MRLSTRYFLTLAGLVGAGFTAFAVEEGITTYRSNVAYVSELQQAQCRVAGGRIGSYLEGVETQLRNLAALPLGSPLFTVTDRRNEFHRLLQLNPAILEIRSVGLDGLERLFVSRVQLDRMNASLDHSGNSAFRALRDRPMAYGDAYFADGSVPHVSLAIRGPGRPEILIIEIDLKFLGDLIAEIHAGNAGTPYIIDGSNHLIAHPNFSLVHQKLDLSGLPQVHAARAAAAEARSRGITMMAQSASGDVPVLVTAVQLTGPDWVILLERPIEQVMAPVRASLVRTAIVLVVLLMAGFGASLYFARRLAKPILALQRGAATLGVGELATRVTLESNDEIADLGKEFNRMAERLQQSYAELERKVELRTQALAEASSKVGRQARELESLNEQLTRRLAELAEKKEEADRASAAKTRFLASASHDLRQPMHAISLLVGVLGDRLAESESHHLVEKVQLSVKAMEDSFNGLLDISRLDAGSIRATPTLIDIPALFRTLELKYEPLADEKNLKLKFVACTQTIRSDAALIERVLGNLIANAIRYTDRGRVLVGCRRDGEFLQLLVIDTGIGIDPDSIDDIFEEFVQLGNPERDRSKGLGLGLSIVRRTCDLLGHQLIVRSRPGRGSTFGIRVPRVDRPAHAASGVKPEAASAALQGAFVVIVDDDQENLFAMDAQFRQWGCHVVTAGSSAEALVELGKHLRAPDIIVTDYRLRARETGLQAIHAIRGYIEAPIPAMIVTGEIGTLTKLDDDRTEWIRKPASPAHLRRVAESLLDSAANE